MSEMSWLMVVITLWGITFLIGSLAKQNLLKKISIDMQRTVDALEKANELHRIFLRHIRSNRSFSGSGGAGDFIA